MSCHIPDVLHSCRTGVRQDRARTPKSIGFRGSWIELGNSDDRYYLDTAGSPSV
jgi:hypothetical protein